VLSVRSDDYSHIFPFRHTSSPVRSLSYSVQIQQFRFDSLIFLFGKSSNPKVLSYLGALVLLHRLDGVPHIYDMSHGSIYGLGQRFIL
jgi:hypothetical protein